MPDAPLHFHLAERKALAARLAFLKTVGRLEPSLRAAAHDAPFDALRTFLTEKANAALDRREDRSPLDVFLSDLGPQLRTSVQAWGIDNVPPELLAALEQFESETQSVRCLDCTPMAPHVCDGSARDDAIVSERGHCIKDLRDDAAFAFERAAHVYSTVGIPAGEQPALMFSTGHDPGSDDLGLKAQGVGGVTFVRDTDAMRQSEVRLVVAVDRFDQAARATVPYVLYHESICHAFAATRGPRGDTEPDDLFAEGWMDAIAFKILEEDVDAWPDRFAADALDAAILLRSLLEGKRCKLAGRVRSQQAAMRHLGRLAAERAEHVLRSTSLTLADARKALVETSLMLNADRRTGDQNSYDGFVVDIYAIGGGPDSARWRDVGAAMRRYRESRRADALFRETRRLRPSP